MLLIVSYVISVCEQYWLCVYIVVVIRINAPLIRELAIIRLHFLSPYILSVIRLKAASPSLPMWTDTSIYVSPVFETRTFNAQTFIQNFNPRSCWDCISFIVFEAIGCHYDSVFLSCEILFATELAEFD